MNGQSVIEALAAAGISASFLGDLAIIMPLVLFCVTLGLWLYTTRRRNREVAREELARGVLDGARRRNGGLTQEEMLRRLRPEQEEAGGGLGASLLSLSEVLLKLVNFNKEETRKKLIQAGDRDQRALSRYIIQRGLGMMLGPVVMWFAAPYIGLEGMVQVGVALTGILVGGIIVDVRLDKAVAARKSVVHAELPVLLDLLTIYLEAGASFDVALARASHALRLSFPVAAAEILFLRKELELSVDREKTLRDFAERLNTQTAKTFVAIVIQSERRGNAIAPSLRRLARDARREVITDIEKKAQKIPTMMQLPMFCFILPAIFASVLGPAIVKIINQMGG